MIITQIFTVTGNTDVDDDIIFCRRLVFVGPSAQLVIKPKKNAPPGAPRIIKIVANVIDSTLAGGSGEITYNLDGDYFPAVELPVGDNGIDPETQAKTGDDGKPSFNQGPIPLPDIASPNFDPILDALNLRKLPESNQRWRRRWRGPRQQRSKWSQCPHSRNLDNRNRWKSGT